ncbi:FMN-binding protein [Paraferrimonas sp. SM1919]|uniref:FMN-binding protein n=1 Tax=Paraferrimonas sp. SM1919 TaxID=2662263 RepID=UPI001F09F231|nr:FMN-binding protein [Paraferrimonas sp. SM1919]
MTPKAYVAEHGQDYQSRTLWLNQELKDGMSEILAHPYLKTRVRYWIGPQASIWLLDEIGKEKPISFGVHVVNNQIRNIEVLAFRESRGDEIRHPFYTQQFLGLKLTEDAQLDQHVDGITGATYSVRAMSKIARVALWLDAQVQNDNKSR